MASQLTHSLRFVFILIILLATGSTENDQDLKFCGIWRHGNGSLNLNVNLSPGCSAMSISANDSYLSINGQITARCSRSDVTPLHKFGIDSDKDINFCLYWEPLLDQLKLQVRGKNLTLCWPDRLQETCCTDLTDDSKQDMAIFGIFNGTIKTDFITKEIRTGYKFRGEAITCKDLCEQARDKSSGSRTGDTENSCAASVEVDMEGQGFRGQNVTSTTTAGISKEPTATVHIPPALKQAAQHTSKVVCTFFQNNSLFQEGHEEAWVLSDVVGITVENEIIADLPEPVRISFYHDLFPKKHSRKCVSWDTRRDPLQVNWLEDGCVTQQRGEKHTECLCNHLTYFTVLVQLEPRPVRHLLVLTAITSLGCLVSLISCITLIVFLCKKSRRSKDQSIPIHMGLAVSLGFLYLLFFLTGILANIGGESLCAWVGAGLHYSLLSSLTWMGIQVFHTFWLVNVIFTPSPKPYVWNLTGFVVPAVPVIILVAVGDIYGVREVTPSDDVSNPYQMCWMKAKTLKALLAHYFTNMTLLVILVVSGFVMLFMVYREIRNRDEWKKNRVAFLSIWGLSCLFGTTWGLTFLDFGPLSDFVLFLSCILNSFQGFFLMLRFYMLEWMRKQAGDPGLGSNSSGSTRQHMLQHPEKS